MIKSSVLLTTSNDFVPYKKSNTSLPVYNTVTKYVPATDLSIVYVATLSTNSVVFLSPFTIIVVFPVACGISTLIISFSPGTDKSPTQEILTSGLFTVIVVVSKP